jgi:DNA-binding transcriptional ArsR family regulator
MDHRQAADPDISAVAAAIGQPARAKMLSALLAGVPLDVSELAQRAGVSSGTASLHLSRLAELGLIAGERSGRRRYYQLNGEDVARALEALQRLAPPAAVRSLDGARRAERLRFARSCYDHLAGKVGVAVTEALIARGFLRPAPDCFSVTSEGARSFAALGIDVEAVKHEPRGFALSCPDWSERRPHLAGALGARLLERFIELDWLRPHSSDRGLLLTPLGSRELERQLGIPRDTWR